MENEHTGSRRNHWTFLTNHARVLIAIARDPGVRLRDLAAICDLTERTVQTIVTDLEADGYLTRTRTAGAIATPSPRARASATRRRPAGRSPACCPTSPPR